MRLVIADTSPINYLILIHQIDLLPRLFERIVLPIAVHSELSDGDAPSEVRTWVRHLPEWVELGPPGLVQEPGLDPGESDAISLAVKLSADLILMDDRAGVHRARAKGLTVTGTLGVLDIAAEQGIVNFSQAVHALEQTNFRVSAIVLEDLLRKHSRA